MQDRPPPYAAVVFDCDSTLSSIEGIEELLARATDRSARALIEQLTAEAMEGRLPLEEVYGKRLEAIRPTADEVARIGPLYVETVLPGAPALIAALRWLGKDVAIVSGGLLPPVAFLGGYLGVDANLVRAVDLSFDGDGQYAGFEEASPLARKGGKPEVLRQLFPSGDVALVGDGATDLEAAEACARFVAFAGVEARPDVIARAEVVCSLADFAALLPLLCTADEIERLAQSGEDLFVELVDRAGQLLGAHGGAEAEPRPPALWIPGPVQVRQELLAAQAAPMIGHRTDEMRKLIHSLEDPLRSAFGLTGAPHFEVAVHSCTATALMEMGLRALAPSPGRKRPRVLAAVCGAFSARFAEIAEVLGCDVVRVESALGGPADLDGVKRELQQASATGEPFDAVTICVSETSTGALTEPADIAGALGRVRGDALLLIDAVTYLGAAPIDAALHGFDFVFAGTQKALALPPGLGVFCVSERMLERAKLAGDRGFFLDLVRIVEGHRAAHPPMTPSVSLYRALALQLWTIEGGALEIGLLGEERRGRSGWELRFARHAKMRSVASQWLEAEGLSRPGPGHHSVAAPSVVCIDLGQDARRSVTEILAAMRDAGYTLAPGYGDLKGTCLRIGHMGDHSVAGFRRLLRTLSGIL